MGIKVTKGSYDKTMATLLNVRRDVNAATLEVLSLVGEYVVAGIRSGELSAWNDQTGNLRASVRYVVTSRGQVVYGTTGNYGSAEGSAVGKQMIDRILSEYARHDFALVVVAGMEYAAYVEAIDGKVVLSEAEIKAERMFPKLLLDRLNKLLRRYENRR